MAGLEESECDTLPFAIDSEASPRPHPPSAAGCITGGMAAADDESDVAVGAFVRLMEHAPPLNAIRATAGLARSRTGGTGPTTAGAAAGGATAADVGDSSGGSGVAEGLTLAAGLSQLAKLRAQLEPIKA